MDLLEWLHRFCLESHAFHFFKEKLTKVVDLKKISDADLEKFEIKTKGEKQRVMGVINGEKIYLEQFKYIS